MQSLGRARVFGQTSMGQALPALFDRLPNGDVLIHAWGDFVTGDGRPHRRARRVPDEPVPLDPRTICSPAATPRWTRRSPGSTSPAKERRNSQ